jgi:hypothetical protein
MQRKDGTSYFARVVDCVRNMFVKYITGVSVITFLSSSSTWKQKATAYVPCKPLQASLRLEEYLKCAPLG